MPRPCPSRRYYRHLLWPTRPRWIGRVWRATSHCYDTAAAARCNPRPNFRLGPSRVGWGAAGRGTNCFLRAGTQASSCGRRAVLGGLVRVFGGAGPSSAPATCRQGRRRLGPLRCCVFFLYCFLRLPGVEGRSRGGTLAWHSDCNEANPPTASRGPPLAAGSALAFDFPLWLSPGVGIVLACLHSFSPSSLSFLLSIASLGAPPAPARQPQHGQRARPVAPQVSLFKKAHIRNPKHANKGVGRAQQQAWPRATPKVGRREGGTPPLSFPTDPRLGL